MSSLLSFLVACAVASEPHDADALLRALPASRHSLEDGIEQIAATEATPISAKLELGERGELLLSVYAATPGPSADAEHNVLCERIGPASVGQWTPVTDVFADVPHVSRSAEQLAVMRMASVSLLDVLARARRDGIGEPFSITPAIRAGEPVFVVLAARDGRVVERTYDRGGGPR